MADKLIRKPGIDILRILSMLGIIGLHLINQGGLINNVRNTSSYIVVLMLLVICYVSVDVFGILSGYLLFNKKNNDLKRIKSLVLTTLFYCIIITIIFYSLNLYQVRNVPIGGKQFLNFLYTGQSGKFSLIMEVVISIIPFLAGSYWYLLCYIFLFLMMPYLNEFISSIDKTKFKKMLITLFILLTVMQSLLFNIDYFKINSGYSPFWLIYCYLIGAYIGKYENDLKINKIKAIKYLIIGIMTAFVLNFTLRYTFNLIFSQKINSIRFIDYVSPFTLISSVCLLIIFKDTKINNKRVCNILKYLGITTFSVYIIHSHYLIYNHFIKDILLFSVGYSWWKILGLFMLYMICIYSICTIIDLIRIGLCKLLFKRRD